eukprot:GHVO01015688.1.p1 GENE.GHVO01015688.1~~GHVO01015688.1.p1  ORF type:complete len:139 (+),score=21.07 GHVO01015688.1:110-526(+)
MDDYKVDIKFPNRESDNPDLVIITGSEDNVLDCKDHLQNLEEEYMQDVSENEMMQQYLRSPSREDDGQRRSGHGHGFTVRNAPWSAAAPDTSSTADFPGLGAPKRTPAAAPVEDAAAPPAAAAAPPRYAVSWGPKVKR